METATEMEMLCCVLMSMFVISFSGGRGVHFCICLMNIYGAVWMLSVCIEEQSLVCVCVRVCVRPVW